MWTGWAQSRRKCGWGGPNSGTDVGVVRVPARRAAVELVVGAVHREVLDAHDVYVAGCAAASASAKQLAGGVEAHPATRGLCAFVGRCGTGSAHCRCILPCVLKWEGYFPGMLPGLFDGHAAVVRPIRRSGPSKRLISPKHAVLRNARSNRSGASLLIDHHPHALGEVARPDCCA
jgi:hypothetical protein